MSNARNLARLIVDSGGDVEVSSLGNVPPSNDASALTTGTLPVARIADGVITNAKIASSAIDASKLANNSITPSKLTAGMVVNITTAEFGNRTTHGVTSNYTFFSTSVNKLYSNSYFLIKALFVGRGAYSHWCGLWSEWNGARTYKGVAYTNEASTFDGNEPNAIHYLAKLATSSTGTANLSFGWTTGNGANDKPVNCFNPNRANNDARINGDTASYIVVYEVLT